MYIKRPVRCMNRSRETSFEANALSTSAVVAWTAGAAAEEGDTWADRRYILKMEVMDGPGRGKVGGEQRDKESSMTPGLLA